MAGGPAKEGRKKKKPHQAQPAAKHGWEPTADGDPAEASTSLTEGLSCDNVTVSRRTSRASTASGGWVMGRRFTEARRASGASATSGGASGRWRSADARSLMAGARSTEGDKPSVPHLGPWVGQAAAAQVATSRRGHSRISRFKLHAQAEVSAPPGLQPGQAAAAQSAMRRRTRKSHSTPVESLEADADVVRARIKEAKAALPRPTLLVEADGSPKEDSTGSTTAPSSPGGSPSARRAAVAMTRGSNSSGESQLSGSWDGAQARSGYRFVRWCDDLAKLYQLGEQVMPSIHKEVQVRHAVGKVGCYPGLEGCDLVIKVRHKNGRQSEEAWRASNERMLNLPACGGIARVYDMLEDYDAYYVIMEKVGGKDLRQTLFAEVRMAVDEVKEVLRQLLQAVAELHSSGCIHKDIKLENVMFDRPASFEHSLTMPSLRVSPRPGSGASATSDGTSGRWKSSQPMSASDARPHSPVRRATDTVLSSSGGMRLLDRPGSGPASAVASTALTEHAAGATVVKLLDFDTLEEWTPQAPKAKDVLGTDQYIAPEAYEGMYSPASDIFAVGVCAYKLLTGQFPFRSAIFNDKPGENWVGSPKMRKIRARLCEEKVDWSHPVFLRENGPQSVIARMLAVDDRQRPTAREVLADPWLATRSSAPSLSPLWVPVGLVP